VCFSCTRPAFSARLPVSSQSFALSLHDALPIFHRAVSIPLVLHGGTGLPRGDVRRCIAEGICKVNVGTCIASAYMNGMKEELERSEEHTSELQSRFDIVCRLLLEKKKRLQIRTR